MELHRQVYGVGASRDPRGVPSCTRANTEVAPRSGNLNPTPAPSP